MNYGKLLALATMLLSALAALGYLLAKDYRHATHWAASAVLIGSVTL